MRKRSLLIWLFLCVLGLTLSFITKGISLIVAIILTLTILVYKKGNPDEKRFIVTIFMVAFLLRAILALGYQWYVDAREGVSFAPDESYYLVLGSFQELLFKGKDISDLSSEHRQAMSPEVKEVFAKVSGIYPSLAPEYASVKNGHIPLTGGRIYSFILGCFYFIFGYSSLLARFFNILIGLSTALIIYFIAGSVFNKDVAKFSFVFFIFSPLQIFFSISILSDMLLIFLMVFIIFMIFRMNNVKKFIVMLIPFLLIFFLFNRFNYLLAHLLLMVMGAVFLIRILDFRKRRIFCFILLAIVFGTMFNGRVYLYLDNFLRDGYHRLLTRHIDKTIDVSNTQYRLLPNKFYTSDYSENAYDKKITEILISKKGFNIDCIDEISRTSLIKFGDWHTRWPIFRDLFLTDLKIGYILKAYFKGLFYVFFKPFPWNIKKLTQAFASVQMMLLYTLFPFVCIGLYSAARNITKEKFMLMVFFFSFASALALGEGNVGGLFRHREITSFAYIIFAASGFVFVRKKIDKI